MRDVDSYFESSVSQVLYHYTGVGALLGIVESNSLWASNIYYLNDSREIVHACDIFRMSLSAYLKDGAIDSNEEEYLNQLNTWVEGCKRNHFNIFIFSLSEHSSLLSQWRSYTPHGKGVSIGISEQTINYLAKQHKLRIGKCLYEIQEQANLVGSLINKMILRFRRRPPEIDLSKAHPATCYFEFLEQFRGDVLQVLALIKHETFVEEQEWRLVSPYFEKYITPDIKYREGASMLIPYIELELGNEKPSFEQVVLGPSTYQELSMSALRQFLSNKGICNSIWNCSIPYREW